MKKIILILFVSFFYLSGISQNSWGNTFSLDNSISEDERTQLEAKIYPNPCKTQKVTIEFASKEIAEIGITNIAGKEVLVEELQFPSNKKIIQLNEIPNGIYLIRIKTTDNKQVVKKLIVSFH